MPDVHAKLSASGAHRWINCPGSVRLEEDFPDTTSSYAREGTLAHALAEAKLKKYFIKGYGKKAYDKEVEPIKSDELYDKSMENYTDVYFDEIKTRALSYKERPFVAIEERVDFSNWVPEGFGTCDCLMIYGDTMTVIDLKYGKGVEVDPEDNPQLMLYALGACAGYGFLFNIKKVTLCIVQPRIDNIKSWDISADDLVAFGERIKPIAKDAYNGSDKLCQGEHCRFCKAKSRCPERAKEMFKAVVEIQPLLDKKIEGLLSNDDISHFLKESTGVIDWIKDLEDEALKAILAGEEIDGYKAVEGRSIRKFSDESKALSTLIECGYDESVLYERKALSLSKLEKLVGKKEFNELLQDEIIKPKGKPTLVTVDDKRGNYVVNDAENMFEKLN